MRVYDVVSTVFFLLLGLSVMAGGLHYGVGSPRNPAPGFMPFVAGAVLSGLSLLALLRTIRRRTAEGEACRPFFPEKGAARRVVACLCALWGFWLLLPPLGFAATCLLFMLFLLRAVEPQPWGRTVGLAVAVTTVSAGLFELALKVQFPEGLLGVRRIARWMF